MNDYLLKIDDALKPLLQRHIKILINSQLHKEGKFILYTHGHFSLNFNIENRKKKKIDILKIPIPFNVEYYEDEKLLYFDYRIKTFAHSEEIEQLIRNVKNVNLSKYYDKILIIEGV